MISTELSRKETVKRTVVTTYEEVKNQTTEEYFNGNQFAVDAFKKKYTAFPGETYVQAIKRVCDFIASAETTEKDRKYWSDRWFDEIYNDWWHPAGSIMQGANSGRKISMANCTTISLGVLSDDEEWDNLESIIRNTTYTVAKCAAYRQGLGVDFSRLRPANMSILNSANESTGAVHWMKFVDSVGYYVGQKGRIPAMLFSISGRHPDLLDFITAKSDHTKIQNANISVQLNDDFYEAVEKGEDYELRFDIPEVKKGEKVYIDSHSADTGCQLEEKTGKWFYLAKRDRPAESLRRNVPAKLILEMIAKNMFNNAEPGIQNIDIARRYSNSDYVYNPSSPYDSRILSTNACSEQYLSRESLCVLASLNAGCFSENAKECETQLAKIGQSMNRFLDNVNEMELRGGTFATPYQKLAIQMLRRTGAGYTNVCGWLFKKNLAYGSSEGNLAVEKFTERFNYHLYKSSIELGREKGSFGLFDRKKFEQSPFVQKMMGLGLVFDAMRNVTCSSIAPTGTLSLMFRDLVLSYGIEPAFGAYFWKRTRISGKYEYYFCVPSVVRKALLEKGVDLGMSGDALKDTWSGEIGEPIAKKIEEAFKKHNIQFKNATDVSPFEKLDLMSGVMKWCDSSISVTYMLPEDTKWEDIANFIVQAHKKEVKSIAAFPDRKMYGIVSFLPFKELATKLIKEGLVIHQQNFSGTELDEISKISASLTENKDSINKTNAPKRPKILPCDVHHIRVRGDDFFVLVGMLGNHPYEIFAGRNGHISHVKKGEISKNKRGHYSVKFEDETYLENVCELVTDEQAAITRLLSLSLRHGADIKYMVEQLEKVPGDMTNFAKSTARALKKYIIDGTKVSGIACSSCNGSNLVRQEGCVVCQDCGNSKCS